MIAGLLQVAWFPYAAGRKARDAEGGTVSGVGIDLGTANTVVCDLHRGVVVQEPSILALRKNGARRRKPLAVGRPALDLMDRVAPNLDVVRPLHGGVITDLETTRRFLRVILHKAKAHSWTPGRFHAVIGVPAGATTWERRGLIEAAEEAHVTRPVLVVEPLAGAVGCGIDPTQPRTHMVVDIGGGTAEVTAFGFGEIVAHRSLRTAGADMTLAVHRHVLANYGVDVGESEAEKLKISAATDGSALVARGRDVANGRARLVSMSAAEVLDAIRPICEMIVAALAACLQELPARSVTDVLDEGIIAFGGGSLVPSFDEMLSDALGLPVKRAERPLTCVAEGAALCLADNSLYKACAAA